MRLLLAIFLLFSRAGQPPVKWECYSESEPLPQKRLTRIKPGALRGRVVGCVAPRLPGQFDGKGTVIVEVQVDEEGNVRCARAISGHPFMRRAALDAAKRWRFRPLKAGGKARPYVSLLPLVVHWDTAEAQKQCPVGKRLD